MLTDRQIRSAFDQVHAAGGERFLTDDTGTRGTGRLMLRIRARTAGKPTAEWMVRWKREGERAQTGIGRWPDLTLAEARRKYEEHRKVIAAGGDPKAAAAVGTVEQLFRAYVDATKLARRESHANEVERCLLTAKSGPLADAIGRDRLARDIAPGDLAAVLAPIYRRAPAMAGHARKYLAAAWAYGIKHDNDFRTASRSVKFGLSSNPAAALPTVPSVARDRVLTADELRRWWTEFPDAAEERTVLVMRLAFLCCGRVTEAMRIQPADVEPGRWVKRETKNNREHASPLGELSQPIAERLAAIGGAMTVQALAKSVLRWCRVAGGEPWTPRDLRRTARTMLEEAGEDPVLLDLHFAHSTMRGGVNANYNHATRWADRVALGARWEAMVRKIVVDGQESYPCSPAMDATEFDQAMKTLELSNAKCAAWMRVTKATVKNWRSGRASIPGPAITLMNQKLEAERFYQERFPMNEAWAKRSAILREITRVRHVTNRAFKSKGWSKDTLAQRFLGCSRDVFIAWLVSRFKPGMTIQNHGLWHLDHHVPLHSAESMEELMKLARYTNIKPMWRDQHWSKGARIPKTTLTGEPIRG